MTSTTTSDQEYAEQIVDEEALTALAAKAHAEQDAMQAADQSALTHAIRFGEFLLEARSRCQHGQWLPWLEANGFGRRDAQRCTRLAIANASDPTLLEGLSKEAALQLLAKPAATDQGTEAGGSEQFVDQEEAHRVLEEIKALDGEIREIQAGFRVALALDDGVPPGPQVPRELLVRILACRDRDRAIDVELHRVITDAISAEAAATGVKPDQIRARVAASVVD